MLSRMDLIGQVTRDLINQRYSNHTIHQLLYGLKATVGAVSAAVIRQDPHTEYLRIGSHFHLSTHVVRGFERSLGCGAFASVFLEDPVVVVTSWSATSLYDELHLEEDYASAVLLRLTSNDRAVGCLAVWFDVNVAGDEDLLAYLTTLANLIALSLEKDEHLASLRELRQIDPETGRLSYAYFYQKLGEEVARCTRSGSSLSVVLLDIDNYKSVIREHGLTVAKQLCREVGEKLNSQMREIDVLARYGIDEFVLYAPVTRMEDAEPMCARFLEVVHSSRFTEFEIGTTLSAGIASMHPGDSLCDLLWRAQKALHEARTNSQHICCARE